MSAIAMSAQKEPKIVGYMVNEFLTLFSEITFCAISTDFHLRFKSIY